MSNKLTNMARELLAIEADLPYRFDYKDRQLAGIDDFEMYTFPQTWGSTSLGFGGMGGQAMTTANTYVFIPQYVNQKCFVYFGSRFAYAVPYSEKFMEDVKKGNMVSVMRSGKYLIKEEDKNEQ